MAKIKKKDRLNYQDACAVVSYWGWIKRSDSYQFYQRYFKPAVSLADAKRRISRFARHAAQIAPVGAEGRSKND